MIRVEAILKWVAERIWNKARKHRHLKKKIVNENEELVQIDKKRTRVAQELIWVREEKEVSKSIVKLLGQII